MSSRSTGVASSLSPRAYQLTSHNTPSQRFGQPAIKWRLSVNRLRGFLYPSEHVNRL